MDNKRGNADAVAEPAGRAATRVDIVDGAAAAVAPEPACAAAWAYARSQGLDWEGLTLARKVALLKSGVQNPREAKSDDVSDLAANLGPYSWTAGQGPHRGDHNARAS